jgi:catechol 2,3-dioxygenase-like lactoylglutathione lyase family enzyme
MYKGSGTHHVAIGVKSLQTMKPFYQDILEFNKIFDEFAETEHEAMHKLFRMPHVVFKGIMFQQETGGIFVELIQMTNPAPRPIRKDFRYGDIGAAKITIAVSDVERLYRELKGRLNFCSKPKLAVIPGWGDYHFIYCKDPEGNIIEFISGANVQVQDRFGGARWIGVSVTDLQRSKSFYQKYLGFDIVVINNHQSFSGLVDEISGSNQTQVRSCLLANSEGGGMLELFEVLTPRGRSIPFATNWGDFGYLQVCLYCDNIHEMAAYFEKEGIEFLCEIQMIDDGTPENAGMFMYIKDPDGIPVEFMVLPQQV